ncbi:TonB-dependent receptor domain-containing protein [Emcibacter sp.]|uniref:TonB-dependent receptor domain-containing protein n=1 Tax=Emcibacter sp. TaxID=1979954 RepID=UPI002AA82927|nr:TonB-dependent receptor [Emcibacter sp.]
MKSDFSSRLKYGVSAIAVASTLSMAAQVTQAQEAAEEELAFEEVVVTGSRIKRKDIQSVSPLQITGAEEIRFSGHNRIEDLMNSLPALEAAQTAYLSNGATGAASLDLRGLGTVRTMVLVNGRRVQPGGIYQSAADINQIPASLVDRVEVMTGGASTAYGADAVAGVVNFIMKKDFEGVEVSAGVAAFQHNNNNGFIQGLMDEREFEYPTGSSGLDGWQYNMDVTMGGSFADDKGHATVYANWRKVEELRQGSRDYSSCALNGGGTSCGGSYNAVIPNFDLYPIDPATGTTIYGYDRYTQKMFDDGDITDEDLIGELIIGGDGFISYTDADDNRVPLPWANPVDANKFYTLTSAGGFTSAVGNLYNYAPINHFQRPDERWSGGAFVDYEINEHFRPYMEVSFMRDRTVAQIAESGTFFAEEYSISCDNPLLSAQQVTELCTDWGLGAGDEFAAYIGKRNVEGGPRASNIEHNTFRIVTGMDGAINDSWSYDLSFIYGSTTSSDSYINDFYAPAIAEALDVELDGSDLVCVSGGTCIPYEVFTYQGITSEQADNLTAVGTIRGITKEYVVNGYVTGDIGVNVPSAEDPVSLVVGAEYRKEVFERLSDLVFEDGLLLGQGGPTASINGAYDVKEIFGEAIIPIVQNAEFAQDLTMELAIRYSDYKTSADSSNDSTTYKVGLSWQPIDMVKVRASYNRAVRAPNVVELFLPQNQGLWQGTDPCAGAAPELTAAQCANTGVTASQYGSISPSPASQYNSLDGGNPDLSPEVADTWTVGAVISPTENLNIQVDYWDIKIKDVIDTISPELAIEQCGLTGDAVFCDLINRAPNGSLWLGTGNYVVGTNVNLGSQHWQGVDFTVDYEIDALDGTFRVDMLGTLMLKKFVQEIPGLASSEYDCKGIISSNCFVSPEWRHSLRLTYTSADWWRVSAKWRYYGSVSNPDVDEGINDGIAAQSYFDLTGTFQLNEQIDMVVGVNNIFDKEPPMIGGDYSTNANTIAGYYDTLGRYLHATVTARF